MRIIKIKRIGIKTYARPSLHAQIVHTYSDRSKTFQVYQIIDGWLEHRYKAEDGNTYVEFFHQKEITYPLDFLLTAFKRRVKKRVKRYIKN